MSTITTYNVKNNKGALEGNWVEENALRDKTGYARRKVPTPLFKDRKTSRIEPTYERVLFHDPPAALSCNSHASEAMPPQFETTFQASTRYSDFASERPGPGPRSSLRDESFAKTARGLHCEQRVREREEKEREWQKAARTTVAKSSFVPIDPSALVRNRFPRGHNGVVVRQENLNVHPLNKAQIDSTDQLRMDLFQGAAVTRYSYAVITGIGLNFPATACDGKNVFDRSSTFTNELNDSSKRHGETTEPGYILDEPIGASVHQRSALKRMLRLFKMEPDIARRLFDILMHGLTVKLTTDQSQEEDAMIELCDFQAAFAASQSTGLPHDSVHRFSTVLTDKELLNIFMYFDADNVGAILVQPFVKYCTSS